MRRQTIGALVLLGAGLATTATAAPKDVVVFHPGVLVRFDAIVTAVREAPAGNPLPGIHIEVKLNARVTDVYLSPKDFAARYSVKVAKGDFVRIAGFTEPATGDVVLAREITTGLYDQAREIFRPNLTVYLRNDSGPFWVETKPID